jgi:hypothetical protein
VTWGQLIGFVREHWWKDGVLREEWSLARDASMLKRLVKKFGLEAVSEMVQGAAVLKWRDLRGLYGPEQVGARWAREAWWQEQNRLKRWKAPSTVKQIFRELGA